VLSKKGEKNVFDFFLVLLPKYEFFVVDGFLRYLFHIQIRNSRNLGKCIPQDVVAHYFLRELYIGSANQTKSRA